MQLFSVQYIAPPPATAAELRLNVQLFSVQYAAPPPLQFEESSSPPDNAAPHTGSSSRRRQPDLTAERAYDWGLANRVCEPERLLDEAKALARDMGGCVPGVMEQVKRMIDTGYSMHFDDAMAYELRVGIESSKQIDSAEIGRRRASVMERGRTQ